MAPKFYSQEWLDEVVKKMDTDAEFLKKAQPLTFHWCAVVTDCPGGIDKKVDFELKEGRPISVKLTEAAVPSEWREGVPRGNYFCVVYGSYEIYAKMNRNEITAMEALAKKVYRMDTDMAQFLSKLGSLIAWTELMASIPCEY